MFFAALLACPAPDDTDVEPAPLTPEQVLATASDGDSVSFRGTVFAVTFDSLPVADTDDPDDDDGQGFDPRPDRWILVRGGGPPPGVVQGEPNFDATLVELAWGLGVHVANADDLPQIGAVLDVTGTFAHTPWNGAVRPTIESPSITVVSDETLGGLDAPCDNDLTCRDQFVCRRDTRTCGPTPEPVSWGSAWHDVDGSCDVDADCPLGQWCDPAYSIPASGPYASPHFEERTAGRHLCVPEPDATLASLCPVIRTPADLVGGRYTQGKEICVAGAVLLATQANDGDTHLQLLVPEPLPFPLADAPYWLFGATTESTPPYKDPSRPGGAIVDPEVGDRTIVVGTYRYDEGHGWFEVHPVKAYFPGSP